jgi:hypothetical protein
MGTDDAGGTDIVQRGNLRQPGQTVGRCRHSTAAICRPGATPRRTRIPATTFGLRCTHCLAEPRAVLRRRDAQMTLEHPPQRGGVSDQRAPCDVLSGNAVCSRRCCASSRRTRRTRAAGASSRFVRASLEPQMLEDLWRSMMRSSAGWRPHADLAGALPRRHHVLRHRPNDRLWAAAMKLDQPGFSPSL